MEKNWTDITPKELTPVKRGRSNLGLALRRTNRLRLGEPVPHDDDLHPYLYRTHDGGKATETNTPLVYRTSVPSRTRFARIPSARACAGKSSGAVLRAVAVRKDRYLVVRRQRPLDGSKKLLTLDITLDVRLWSTTKAMESGKGSTVKRREKFGISFSNILKSRKVEPATSFPFESLTVTGTSTKFTFKRISVVVFSPRLRRLREYRVGRIGRYLCPGWKEAGCLEQGVSASARWKKYLARSEILAAPMPGVMGWSTHDKGGWGCGTGASGTEGCCCWETATQPESGSNSGARPAPMPINQASQPRRRVALQGAQADLRQLVADLIDPQGVLTGQEARSATNIAVNAPPRSRPVLLGDRGFRLGGWPRRLLRNRPRQRAGTTGS